VLRVLLTGGTGFLGSHMARALLGHGHETALLVRSPEKARRVFGAELSEKLEIIGGDMTDEHAVAAALRGRHAVIHAAALVALERKHAARVLHDNRRGIEIVVGSAVAAGIERVVHVSSVVALFRAGSRSITTESLGDNRGSAYARSKIDCETYVRALQASGAPIQITYPAAVIGPDDPGLSEANRGLLALFRDASIVTDTGLQLVDVRDVAAAHVRLLEGETGPGRHLFGGHFVPWGRLIDLLDDITGRKLRRIPVPGAVLRALGVVADAVKRVWDFPFPLSQEAMRFMTQWTPVEAPTEGTSWPAYRDPRVTLSDTLRWFCKAGHLPVEKLGRLS
jgi:nucleoside-diphosphate-sugar epimerase